MLITSVIKRPVERLAVTSCCRPWKKPGPVLTSMTHVGSIKSSVVLPPNNPGNDCNFVLRTVAC